MKSLLLFSVAVLQPGHATVRGDMGLSSLRSVKRRDNAQMVHTELIQTPTNSSVQDDQLALGQLEALDDPRHKRWPKTPNGWTAWVFAVIFVLVIAQIPVSLHMFEHGLTKAPSMVTFVE